MGDNKEFRDFKVKEDLELKQKLEDKIKEVLLGDSTSYSEKNPFSEDLEKIATKLSSMLEESEELLYNHFDKKELDQKFIDIVFSSFVSYRFVII